MHSSAALLEKAQTEYFEFDLQISDDDEDYNKDMLFPACQWARRLRGLAIGDRMSNLFAEVTHDPEPHVVNQIYSALSDRLESLHIIHWRAVRHIRVPLSNLKTPSKLGSCNAVALGIPLSYV